MRAQANFIEHAPLTLILIGAVELAKGTTAWLWGLAALFLAARIAHALGMEGGSFQRFRGLGVMTSFLVEVVLAVIALKIVILG